MVRFDKACAGVMFSIDTETGFPHGVLINASTAQEQKAFVLSDNVILAEQSTDFLVQCGIDSISLNPDSAATAINDIAAAEQTFSLDKKRLIQDVI